jgi:hypothetical protein
MGSTISDARFGADTASDGGGDSGGGSGDGSGDGSGADPEVLQGTAVTWQRLVRAQAKGTTLTKKGGCDGCSDAGASSAQSIAAGKNGFLEFTVDETQRQRYAGLSVLQKGTSATQIQFALSLQAGYAEVREKGAYRADIIIKKGDVLRISVQQGVVKYARNGQVFYTSSVAPAAALYGTASLLSRRSTIQNALIASGN